MNKYTQQELETDIREFDKDIAALLEYSENLDEIEMLVMFI